MGTSDFYQYIDDKGYQVFTLSIKRASAVTIPNGSIGLDPDQIDTSAEEKALLAHEVGHLETGTFYDQSAPQIMVDRCEERANRWAYRRLVPPSELGQLLADGRDIDEISEHFGVPEPFIRGAYDYYMTAGVELTDEETAAVEELSRYELTETPPKEEPFPAPLQPVQEAAAIPDKPESASPTKAPERPRWAFVRRGYLILFDEVQPGDEIFPEPKNQPPNDPHWPRILQPVPKKPRGRKCAIDIWK